MSWIWRASQYGRGWTRIRGDRHGELVKIGEREGVQIKMFDKSEEILMTVNVNGSDDFIIAPRTSTRLSRTVHRLSPIF